MQSAEHRANEAERLIKEPLLVKALAALEARYIDELLSGPPVELADPDRWRRERIDSVNTVRAIPQAIKAAFYEASAELTRRGGVA
jgi:hypothetical protein